MKIEYTKHRQKRVVKAKNIDIGGVFRIAGEPSKVVYMVAERWPNTAHLSRAEPYINCIMAENGYNALISTETECVILDATLVVEDDE